MLQSRGQALLGAKYLHIEQRVEWVECLPCCEEANFYTISLTDVEFEEYGKVIGQAQEKPSGAANLYLLKCARECEVELQIGGELLSTAARRFSCCTYCCLPILNCVDSLRPVLQVSAGGKVLGRIESPSWCGCLPLAAQRRGLCSALELDIFGADQKLLYRVTAPCLNPGFVLGCCGCVADCCAHKEFKILDSGNETVGKIENIYNGVLVEWLTRGDRFGVQFPSVCPLEHKVLLIHAAIFIDYLAFAA